MKHRSKKWFFELEGESIYITENDGTLNFWGHEIYKVDDFAFVSGSGDRVEFRISEDLSTVDVQHTSSEKKENFILKRKNK